MNVELKNVKTSEFASRETDCFEATIYIDGKKAGHVSNDGDGGANRYMPWDLEETLAAHAKTLPPMRFNDGNQERTLDHDADTFVGDLLHQFRMNKWLKKQCAKSVLYREPGRQYQEGEYSMVTAAYTAEVKAKLVAKYGPGVEIFNERFVPQPKPLSKGVTVSKGQIAPIW